MIDEAANGRQHKFRRTNADNDDTAARGHLVTPPGSGSLNTKQLREYLPSFPASRRDLAPRAARGDLERP
ncbi:MAG: hypothetical protein MHM6MM_005532 [Cercozoa sp. M6MM]